MFQTLTYMNTNTFTPYLFSFTFAFLLLSCGEETGHVNIQNQNLSSSQKAKSSHYDSQRYDKRLAKACTMRKGNTTRTFDANGAIEIFYCDIDSKGTTPGGKSYDKSYNKCESNNDCRLKNSGDGECLSFTKDGEDDDNLTDPEAKWQEYTDDDPCNQNGPKSDFLTIGNPEYKLSKSTLEEAEAHLGLRALKGLPE